MEELTSGRLIAEVAVEGTLYAFDKLFGYEIPEHLRDSVSAGVRVVVPFGRGNRKRVGLVFSVYRGSADWGTRSKPDTALLTIFPASFPRRRADLLRF